MTKKQFREPSEARVSTKRILGAAFALLVFFLLLTSVIGLGQKFFALRARSADVAAQQAALEQKEHDLVTTNNYLATPEGTEQSLRERYNYVKPGEGMIIINPQQLPPPAPQPPSTGIAHWWDELLQGLGIRNG